MKTKSIISGYMIRSGAAAVFFLFAFVALTSAFNSANRSSKSAPANRSRAETVSNQSRTLTFAERVAYQRAIEEVYWRHRIWPTENADAKPSLEKVMSQAQIEKKVEDYLRHSQALEDYWQRPISPDQLQAEMERIASHTKQPGVLREIFAALGNDPFLIAECLARPVLAERLLTDLYAHDERFHGELKRRAEADLLSHGSVEQMKQTSGTYREIEWAKSDDKAVAEGATPKAFGAALQEQDAPNAVKLDSTEWNDNVAKLAAAFESSPRRVRSAADMSAHSENAPSTLQRFNPSTSLPIGKLSPLQEDDGHYYARAVIIKGKDRLKLATVAWMKQPFDSWRAKAETQVPLTMAAAITAKYTLPTIGGPSVDCTDDTWTATSTTNAPAARYLHIAVWTGSEMIVWGGQDENTGMNFNTGGRYNPSTDSWTATSTTNAPEARIDDTAVWTGSEMIIWGGDDITNVLNTGGRYNPSTDSWTATSTTNAPDARFLHAAVWTGTNMIVWGGVPFGSSFYLNTGGRYNPGTDSWTATSTTNAPAGRQGHTAVWADTTSQMIVWGGFGDGSVLLNTGGRYTASTDSWTATSTTNAPTGRAYDTAVWTGSEMIIWGGDDGVNAVNTGGRYNPGTDSWAATSTTNAPDGRFDHTAVWRGNEMIVWGGTNGGNVNPLLNTGGRYDPPTDSWTATSTTNAPEARANHTAVWADTTSQMIAWGGLNEVTNVNTGGRYCAQGGPSPTPTPTATATATASGTSTPTPTATATATATPTATATATATPTPTPTPTPCEGRCSPTPRPRPTANVRPTPPPRITPVPPPPSPRPTPWPRPTPPSRLTPVPSPTSPRPTPAPRP
jgi:N-acetylneuraminic acid mutarotase